MSSIGDHSWRQALLAGTALVLLVAGGAAQARVGITSQTTNNPLGTPPAQQQRTLKVGIDVFANERIQTSANDRAHLLFLDGSSLTVGPNSDLMLDKFVYDPNTGTGELAVSATKGIFRLVGGKITKSNEATIKVGTSTIGIRGGITIVNAPECPPGATSADCQAQAYFMFGQQLTVTTPGGSESAVRPGSLIAFGGNAPPAPPVIAPPNSLAGPIAQLEAPSGTGNTGPSGIGGTIEQKTGGSGLPPTNSALPPDPASGAPQTAQFASNTTGAGSALGGGPDPNNPQNTTPPANNEPPPPPPPVTTTISAEGRFLREEPNSSVTIDAFGISAVRDPNNNAFLQSATVTTTTSTTLVTDPGTLNVTSVNGVTFEVPWNPGAGEFSVTGTSSVGPVEGTGFVSPNGDFYAYNLKETANGNRGIGFFGGDRTPTAGLPTTGFAAREFFTLDNTKPFLNDVISAESVVANATPGLQYIAWSPNLSPNSAGDQRPTWFQATLNIQGKGEAQSSYLSITTGTFATDDAGQLYAAGGGQAFVRRNATEGPIKFTSAASSAQTQNGSSIYGPAGDYTILVPEHVSYNGENTVRTPSSAASLPFDTLAVADIYYPVVATRPTAAPADLGVTRTTQTMTGFTGALVEKYDEGFYSSYAVYNVTPDQVTISTDAATNRVSGVFEMTTGAPPADTLSLFWGSATGNAQNSSFVDDKRFAMRESSTNGGLYNGESVVTQMSMVTHTAVALPTGILPDGVSFCECQYLTWGYWQADLNYISGARAGQRDYVTLGTWVAGNATLNVDLPSSGTATYTGHIMGNVENDMGNSYVAVGKMDTTWDFGSRTGGLTITNFDGANYSGSTYGSPGTGNFGGSFTGTSPGATNRQGQVWGAFYRSPTDATLNQAGNFKLNSTETNYKAAGTWQTQRVGPVVPPPIITLSAPNN